MRSVRNAHLVRDGEIVQTVTARSYGKFSETFDPPIGPFKSGDTIKFGDSE